MPSLKFCPVCNKKMHLKNWDKHHDYILHRPEIYTLSYLNIHTRQFLKNNLIIISIPNEFGTYYERNFNTLCYMYAHVGNSILSALEFSQLLDKIASKCSARHDATDMFSAIASYIILADVQNSKENIFKLLINIVENYM